MAENNDVTMRMHVDITDLKKSMADAQRQIKLANAEFKATSATMEDWQSTSEGLSAKLKQLDTTLTSQKSVLSDLQSAYNKVAEEQGENSKGAQELAIKIANQKAAIANTEKSINKYETALSDLDTENADVADSSGKAEKGIKSVGDQAKDSENKTSGLKGKLADLAKNGMAAVATAAAGLVTAFLGSAEATREYREDINKLQTAYKTAGYGAETATEMYKSFFSVLGEEDRSVEAVNHLAKLTQSEEELAKWTDICAGVWGTFGDSLPIEGLTEAANETAKVGQVTGPLADALNWAGISEDEFNQKLAECNSEQERATLITNTLNETYAEAAKNYKELNGDIMDAQRAQSELTDAMAKVGAAAEPVMTSIKLFGASLLTELLPGIEEVSSALMGLVKGEEGAADALGSSLSDLIMSALNKVIELLPTVANIGLSLITSIIQGLLSALPQLVTTAIEIINTLIIGLSTAIPEIVLAIVDIIPKIIDAIMQQLPIFIQACVTFLLGIVQAIPQVISAIVEALPQLITAIVDGLVSGITALTQGAVQLLMAIVEAIPQIIDALVEALPQVINAIITALITALPQLMQASITLFMAMVEAIPQIIVALANALPQIIDAIIDTLLDNLPLLLECAVQLFMAIVEAIPEILVALGKAVPEIVSAIMTALNGLLPKLVLFGAEVLKKVLKFFADIIVKAGTKTGEFITKIINKLKELPGKLWTKFTEAIAKVTAFFSDINEKAKTKASEFVNKIIEKIKSLPDDMWKTFKSAIAKVVSFGNDLKTKAEEAGKKLVKGIKDKIEDLPSDIKEVGKNIVEGLWNGINDKFDWLTGKIKSFASDVTSKLKSFFGIKSPSRVMRDQVGKYLALGVAAGIDKNKDAVTQSMKNLANSVSQPFEFGAGNIKAKVNSAVRSASNKNSINGNASTQNTTYTFNQYNSSPKALSRLEIYRQTKNQLNFAKGV